MSISTLSPVALENYDSWKFKCSFSSFSSTYTCKTFAAIALAHSTLDHVFFLYSRHYSRVSIEAVDRSNETQTYVLTLPRKDTLEGVFLPRCPSPQFSLYATVHLKVAELSEETRQTVRVPKRPFDLGPS